MVKCGSKLYFNCYSSMWAYMIRFSFMYLEDRVFQYYRRTKCGDFNLEFSPRKLGKMDSNFDTYFSNGLKLPPRISFQR